MPVLILLFGLMIIILPFVVSGIIIKSAAEPRRRSLGKSADVPPAPNNFDRLNLNYRKRFNFLTPSEKHYFKQLLAECVAKNQLVFAKVRLEDLVYIPERVRWGDRMAMRGFVKSRHIDFVVTDMDCNVLYCVELDDPSHLRPDRQERDRKVDTILETAGIELRRITH